MRDALCLALAVSAAACSLGSSESTPPRYVVEWSGSGSGTVARGTRGPVGIGTILASPLCQSERVAFRVAPDQIYYHDTHTWAVPPAAMVRQFVIDWLRTSGPFAEVVADPATLSPQREPFAVLDAELIRFEVVVDGAAPNRWAARVAMRVVVRMVGGQDDGRLAFNDVLEEETPIPDSDRHMRGVVEAFRTALAEIVEQIDQSDH